VAGGRALEQTTTDYSPDHWHLVDLLGMAATRTKHVDRATSVGGTNLKNSILAFNLETNNEREIFCERRGGPTG